MITNSDLDLIARDALDTLAALAERQATAVAAPAGASADDDGREEASRDAM